MLLLFSFHFYDNRDNASESLHHNDNIMMIIINIIFMRVVAVSLIFVINIINIDIILTDVIRIQVEVRIIIIIVTVVTLLLLLNTPKNYFYLIVIIIVVVFTVFSRILFAFIRFFLVRMRLFSLFFYIFSLCVIKKLAQLARALNHFISFAISFKIVEVGNTIL